MECRLVLTKISSPNSLRFVWIMTFMCSYVWCCHFPSEMYVMKDTWRISSPDKRIEVPHNARTVSFNDGFMTIDHVRNVFGSETMYSYSYICLERLPSIYKTRRVKYIVKRIEDGFPERFQCIEFVFRDINVVQWRLSALTNFHDRSLCYDDSLKFLDAPLVYFHHKDFWKMDRNRQNSYKVCPLVGGYLLTWYNASNYRHCKDSIPPLKLENECVLGEGLRIYMLPGHSSCPLPEAGFTRIEGTYRCFANWSYDNYDFMLLNKDYGDSGMLCMRMPRYRELEFDAYIFADGVCDSTQRLTSSNAKVKLTLRKFSVQDECADETPACYKLRDETCRREANEHELCRHSCDICPDDCRLPRLKFAPEFEGYWMRLMNRTDKEMWRISRSHIDIPSMGNFSNVGETFCSTGIYDRGIPGFGDGAIEYTLYRTFSNGCSPRTATILLVNRSETVISYRISTSIPAPFEVRRENDFVLHRETGWWCRKVNYAYDAPPLLDLYRRTDTGWYNLVSTKSNYRTVPCLLPLEKGQAKADIRLTQVNLPSRDTKSYVNLNHIIRTNCTGRIELVAEGSFELALIECAEGRNGGKKLAASLSRQHFHCMASFTANHGKRFVITRTPPERSHNMVGETYVCWVFSYPDIEGKTTGTVYWYPVGTCDSNADLIIDWTEDAKMPLASLGFIKVSDNSNTHSVLPWVLTICSFLAHACSKNMAV